MNSQPPNSAAPPADQQTTRPEPRISQTRQRFAMGGMVAVAVLALVLAATYQDDNKLGEPRIVGGNPSATVASDAAAGQAGGDAGQAAAEAGAVSSASPIEGFLPKSGEASACRESIGVDLAAGFGARLTINGIEIPPEQMNVNLDENGQITDVITASRSLGHYTFKPDDDCPNGSLLRPVGNVLEVCVYRLSDVSQACSLRRENVFDSL